MNRNAKQTCPHVPVNHFSHPTAFGVLNRKARGKHWDGKTALQGEQQHDVKSAGHTVIDGRKRGGARHCGFGQCRSAERYPDDVKKLPFSYFPSLNGVYRTAKPGSDPLVDPVIRPYIYTDDLPVQG